MNRRSFLKTTGIVLSGLILAPKDLLIAKGIAPTVKATSKISKGDIITIAGVNDIKTGSLQRFVITGDASSGIVSPLIA